MSCAWGPDLVSAADIVEIDGDGERSTPRTASHLSVNAQLQMEAMQLGPVSFLHDDEIDLIWGKGSKLRARGSICWRAAAT
jgi:hypothetical protein